MRIKGKISQYLVTSGHSKQSFLPFYEENYSEDIFLFIRNDDYFSIFIIEIHNKTISKKIPNEEDAIKLERLLYKKGLSQNYKNFFFSSLAYDILEFVLEIKQSAS